MRSGELMMMLSADDYISVWRCDRIRWNDETLVPTMNAYRVEVFIVSGPHGPEKYINYQTMYAICNGCNVYFIASRLPSAFSVCSVSFQDPNCHTRDIYSKNMYE